MDAAATSSPRLVSQIHRLPSLLVNQIAAGEVVERPASVVKELLDNALDAGASRIRIELEKGGVELIRVADDGSGMAPEELPLAVAPHATSKISSAADLDRIATMGFRGEALASIASVSRLSIRSRQRGAEGAGELSIEGDDVGAVRPASGAAGTTVAVRNLFFNTPARRKFLRTPQTEQNHCMETIRAAAIAHCSIAFEAHCDGRALLDLPPDQSPRDRVLTILGEELSERLLEVSADEFDDARGMALWGMVGLPEIARSTGKGQRLFINGRPIQDRSVQHAIREAYRGLIEPGRYPTAVIMLEMSPAGVDVNVHPTKSQVRFRDPGLVYSVVLRAVREGLRGADLAPKFNFDRSRPRGPEFGAAGAGQDSAHTEPGSARAFVERFRNPPPEAAPGRFDYTAVREAVASEQAVRSVEGPPSDESVPSQVLPSEGAAESGSGPGRSGGQSGEKSAAPGPEWDAPDQSLGPAPRPADRILQVHNSFLVTQDEQGMVIIDQHALHERVMFEKIMERLARGPLESQRLLTPVVVEVDSDRAEALEGVADLLGRLGVEASPIGPGKVGIHAFPTLLFNRGVDPGAFMADLLERVAGSEIAAGDEEAVHEIVDMMACKAAVKAGDRLSEEELGELLTMRDRIERSSNCPHGRPTTVRLTIRDLEKAFGRT